jgi:hypothetical protein
MVEKSNSICFFDIDEKSAVSMKTETVAALRTGQLDVVRGFVENGALDPDRALDEASPSRILH